MRAESIPTSSGTCGRLVQQFRNLSARKRDPSKVAESFYSHYRIEPRKYEMPRYRMFKFHLERVRMTPPNSS
jgi:hypothetical protein